MARRGRPAKKGARWPGGKLRAPTTLAQIKLTDERARLRETAVVAAQPHRRGTADPSHPWAGTAIGRLLLPRLRKQPRGTQLLLAAADAWRQMSRKLWRIRSVSDPNSAEEREHTASVEERPQEERDERARALAARVDGLRQILAVASPAGFAALRDAILFDHDVAPELAGEAMLVLARLARELGFVRERAA